MSAKLIPAALTAIRTSPDPTGGSGRSWTWRTSGPPCSLRHPAYAERYQTTKRRLGKQRGARVAQIDIARRLTEAIWHMLTRNQPFAPAGAPLRLAA